MHNGSDIAVRSVSAALVVAVMVLGGVACSSDDAATDSSDDAATDVLLSEWVLEPDPTSTDGGEVTFTGDNQGGVVHELVVVRAESASDLPTEGEGPGNAVNESELPAGAVVGEVEDIAPGSSKDLTLDLDAGSYVLFCNLVGSESDGPAMEGRSHFAEGMYAEFTVN
jgi:uncharacterized cupredoxin-like copper-binding protein